MEIEAKLTVPDERSHRRLQRLQALGKYRLGKVREVRVRDRYLDDAQGRLRRAGYALRLRSTNQGILLTLKSTGREVGAIHRRLEWEQSLPSVDGWPAALSHELERRLRKLVDPAKLKPLLDLEQVRQVRSVMRGERRVAEWSLDRVRAVGKDKASTFLELEIELLPGGREGDLKSVLPVLEERFGLTPVTGSKLERLLLPETERTASRGGTMSKELMKLKGLGPRTVERLAAVGIETTTDLVALGPAALAKMPGIGARRARAILSQARRLVRAAAAAPEKAAPTTAPAKPEKPKKGKKKAGKKAKKKAGKKDKKKPDKKDKKKAGKKDKKKPDKKGKKKAGKKDKKKS